MGGLHQCLSEKISQGELARGQQVRFSGLVQAHSPAESRAFAPVATEGTGERDSPPEGTGFEPSVPRQEKWSTPGSSDQTRGGRTLTLGGGGESSLEGRDIELSVSPKDIRTSPYDLCANRSDRRQSREGDRWFVSTSLQRRVGRNSKLPQGADPCLPCAPSPPACCRWPVPSCSSKTMNGRCSAPAT